MKNNAHLIAFACIALGLMLGISQEADKAGDAARRGARKLRRKSEEAGDAISDWTSRATDAATDWSGSAKDTATDLVDAAAATAKQWKKGLRKAFA